MGLPGLENRLLVHRFGFSVNPQFTVSISGPAV
jgi:hypothetical protein